MLRGLPGSDSSQSLSEELAWRALPNLALVRSFYLRDGSTNSIFGFGSTSGSSRASASVPK
jgi:hypothetical protein